VSFTLSAFSQTVDSFDVSLFRARFSGYTKVGEEGSRQRIPKRDVEIKLALKGENLSSIHAFQFSDLKIEHEGEVLEAFHRSFGIHSSLIKRKFKDKWYQPLKDTHSRKPPENLIIDKEIFITPFIGGKIDSLPESKIDAFSGKITLFVASEENGCLIEVPNFLVESNLTSTTFDLHGVPLKFTREPKLGGNGANLVLIKPTSKDNKSAKKSVPSVNRKSISLVYEVSDSLKIYEGQIFDIYFEDSQGNKITYTGYSISRLKDGDMAMSLSLTRPLLDSCSMFIVPKHADCMQTIPFNFEDVVPYGKPVYYYKKSKAKN